MDVAVHAGGVGTVSQFLAAGVPQIVAYSVFDQPDNAERVVKTGAGFALPLTSFSSVRAIPLLRRCLTDKSVRSSASECRRRFLERPSAALLLKWLESRMQPVLTP